MTIINTALLRVMTTVSGLRARFAEDRGQDLLEYALLGGLIAAAITAAAVVLTMSGALTTMADGIARCIDFDSGTPCGTAPLPPPV